VSSPARSRPVRTEPPGGWGHGSLLPPPPPVLRLTGTGFGPAVQGPVDATLAARLEYVCRGMTIAEVARRTGFATQTVRRYLWGQSRPRPEFLSAVCARFGVSGGWLLTGLGAELEPVEPTEAHTTEALALVRRVGILCERARRLGVFVDAPDEVASPCEAQDPARA
jgi:transcriptional regulator with XRE-family HTH domain